MKLITLLIAITIIFYSLNSPAQFVPGTISGSIKTDDKRSAISANITLCVALDTSRVTTTESDSNSTFFFHSVRTGKYLLKITSTFFETHYTSTIIIDSSRQSVQLPAILLTPKVAETLNSKVGQTLERVVVTAKRPLIEQQIDRMVVNVDAMIIAPGSNALEILEKTPGVSVELSGGIGLNGKSNVMVMIDGRPTQFSPGDLAAYLKSIPGGTLDKIELIDNPPARYEAAGNAIINIRLKKNKLQGFTGLVSAGLSQGKYSRSNNSINLNYNRRKISVTTVVGYNRDGGFNESEGKRIFYSSDGKMISQIQSDNFSRYQGDGLNGRITFDFAANKKTSYGAIVNINARSSGDQQVYRNVQLNEQELYDSAALGLTDAKTRWSGAGANLNFLHKFNSKGRELSADLNYLHYRNRSNQHLFNAVNDADDIVLYNNQFRYLLPSTLDIYSGQVDYVHPLAKKTRIDAGFKTSQVTNDNAFNVEGAIIAPGVQPGDRSNHFVYRETISAIYLNARKDWRRVGLQAGLRTEYTVADGNQLGNRQVASTKFRRDYINAFPSLFVSYKLDTMNKNFLDFSYSRRIRRPNYQMLNPFEIFVDNYSYTSGNPMLNPQLANQLELKYRYKKYFGIGLQQGFYNDVIFQITETNKKIFITRPQNVARGAISSFIFNGMVPVAKWWNLNISGNIYRMKLTGETDNGKLEQVAVSLRGSVLNQFTFGAGWNAEVNGYYNGRDISGQRIIDPRYRLNTGVQKKILKGKGSVRVTVEDIFYSWKQQDVTNNLVNAVSYNLNRSDTRRLSLALTYSFGKETNSKKRSLNENSAAEEKSRVD